MRREAEPGNAKARATRFGRQRATETVQWEPLTQAMVGVLTCHSPLQECVFPVQPGYALLSSQPHPSGPPPQ